MKRKNKRENCGQFLKFLPRTILLEDAVNQPFPYKCFCSISISGSPCGWYLLTTIQTTFRQYNFVVTLTLNFVLCHGVLHAHCPFPRLHRSILDLSAWPCPAVTSPFLPQTKCSCPGYTFSFNTILHPLLHFFLLITKVFLFPKPS